MPATETLPVRLGYRTIDVVCENALLTGKNKFTLSFHGGGEPTMASKKMKQLINYARKKEVPCHANLTTNGCWSAADREWILNNFDDVSLSFDGLREIQDRQRPLASGRGTYDLVMASITAMDQRQLSYGIRMTVTEDSVDQLPENMKFLCSSTDCRVFQVEPASNHGRAMQGHNALTQYDRFARAFLKAYDIAVAAGRHMYYSGARPWVITPRFCQAPENALIVGTDGFLTACYEVCSRDHELAGLFCFGDISENGIMSVHEKTRQALFEKIEQRKKQCRDCFCFWHCAGDCPSKTMTADGRGHLRFDRRCDLNRHITRELIIRNITNGNGIWQGASEEQMLVAC